MTAFSHWSDRYIGYPYVTGKYDCGEMARRVMRDEFGKDVEIPDERLPGLRGGARLIDRLRDKLADPISSPREGDAALMRDRAGLWHIGIVAVLPGPGSSVDCLAIEQKNGMHTHGEYWILHNMRNVGGCRHRPRELVDAGLVLEGYYRWQ